MKPNPKLHYFIENKINETKDNPYILLEEGDKEKVQTLIKENASNKEVGEKYLKWLEETRFNERPFTALYNIVQGLKYRKKDNGRKKVNETLMELFPNWDELQRVSDMRYHVVHYHESLIRLKEDLKKLTELSKQTKEEN